MANNDSTNEHENARANTSPRPSMSSSSLRDKNTANLIRSNQQCLKSCDIQYSILQNFTKLNDKSSEASFEAS